MNNRRLIAGLLSATTVACSAADSSHDIAKENHKAGLKEVLADEGMKAGGVDQVEIHALAPDSEEYRRLIGTRRAIENALPDTCERQNENRYDNPGNERDRSEPLAQLDEICDKNPLSLTPNVPSANLVYAFDGPELNGEKVEFVDLTVSYTTEQVKSDGSKAEEKHTDRVLVIDRSLLNDGNEHELAKFLVRDAISAKFHPLDEDRIVKDDFDKPFTTDQFYASEGFAHNLDLSLQRNFDIEAHRSAPTATSAETAKLKTFELKEAKRMADGRHIEWERPTKPGVYKLMDETVPHAHFVVKKDGEVMLLNKESGDEIDAQSGTTNTYPLTKQAPDYVEGEMRFAVFAYIVLKDDMLIYLESNGVNKPNLDLVPRDSEGGYMVGQIGSTDFYPFAYSELDGITRVKNPHTGQKLEFRDFVAKHLD